MDLKQNQEDQRKIHAEVNQIMNQRFLVTTAAITVFAVMTAWSFSGKVSLQEPQVARLFAISAAQNIVLATLSIYNIMLRRYARVLTTYLLVTRLSDWEAGWAQHRDTLRFALTDYNIPQSVIFAVLGILTVGYPFFAIITELKNTGLESTLCLAGPYLTVAVLAAGVELLATASSFFKCIEGENKAKKQWEKHFPNAGTIEPLVIPVVIRAWAQGRTIYLELTDGRIVRLPADRFRRMRHLKTRLGSVLSWTGTPLDG